MFERDNYLGGLAAGMRGRVADYPDEWEWDLEQFYHHWFTNDNEVFDLAKEIGIDHKILIQSPESSILYNDQIFPFDSPINLLKFPHFSPVEKFRVAYFLASLKYLFNAERSRQFESITAHEYIPKIVGQRPYQLIFEPLLKGKFGEDYQTINMRWFWARIFKRTPKLAYYQGGFSAFAQDLADAVIKQGGLIQLGTSVEHMKQINDYKIEITVGGKQEIYDKVVVTTPPFSLAKLMPDLPTEFKQQLQSQPGLGAYVVILSLHHSFMDNTYWLNINQENWPFLAVVEHTNLVDKSHYNNEHVLYVGNYVDKDHPHMKMTVDELIQEFTPFLKRINPLFSEESIIRKFLLKTPYAQPIVGLQHEQRLLPIQTPLPGVLLATMAQVYPWDRGTNYAIEIGRNAARQITQH